MNINEVLFLLQFLLLVGITLYKIYNLMNLGQKYTLSTGFILFAVFGIFYLVGMVITLTDYTTATYSILFYLESILLLPGNIFFILFEIVMQNNKEMEAIYTGYKGPDQ